MPRLTTRDYKRPSRSSSAAKLREFGLGVLVGAVLASAGFLIAGAHARHRAAAAASSHAHPADGSQDAGPRAPGSNDTSSNGSDADPASGSPSASASAGTQAPHYDFYRMLPSFKVPVPHEDDRESRPPPPPAQPAVATVPGTAYVLQVGSYHSTVEADQMRARLGRLGISAQVQHIVDGSRILNRVRIGPVGEADLQKVREQLRTANIHALVIRADR
jgi:cell division protein FtsN